jgi:hypothetical protein
MRKLAGLLGLSLCLGLAPHPASAAGFDGHWVADIPAQGRCNGTAVMNLVVSGDAVSGEVQNPGDHHSITGQVRADGTGDFAVEHHWTGTLSFTNDHFEATWNNGACDRHAAGDRAPDDAGKAALAAERKQRQDAYADLIRRAEAGEAIDYTQLRTDFVFAKDWEFYDSKARGLLDQANGAVKGKDCPHALTLLDRVILLDFTMDSAHALRAECLRKSDQNDQARIEDGIAKGLIHSLMDGWGGPHGLAETLTSSAGATEESAYVVSSYREEMDVLANRHIQLKTRQTEIRGSNGRYYDLVHGVSIATGLGRIDVSGRDLYFDITSFVTGRVSRRAAAQVLQAQLQ